MTDQRSRPKKKRLTLSTCILLGVVFGILSGILFGEYCAPLEVIGNAFIGLLQMTILPYIIVSLILAISAEAGSAWSLLYPQYGVVIPKPRIATYPAGYGVAMGNQNLLIYLNNWLTVTKNSNRARRAYDRWILGKGAEEKKPRWSVIRNVLHLVK